MWPALADNLTVDLIKYPWVLASSVSTAIYEKVSYYHCTTQTANFVVKMSPKKP